MAQYGYTGNGDDLTPIEREALDAIGEEVFCVDTLDGCLSDSKDFHDIAVWNMREALKRAFLLGKESK